MNLISQVMGFIYDIAVGFVAPLIILAALSVVFSIFIAANPIATSIVIAIITLLMVAYCYRQESRWQMFFYLILGGTYVVLGLTAPEWAVIWGLIINLITLSALIIVPGAVLPTFRTIVMNFITIAIIFHVALAAAIWKNANVFLVIVGIAALGLGSWIFSQSARPYEVRRAQRTVGRLGAILGIILLLASFLPTLNLPRLTIPRPIVSAYNILSNNAEEISLSTQRDLIGERAKTEALSQIEPLITSLHRERLLRGAEKIPSLPLSEKEWEELGIK